jgi:hypothetical protein
MNEGESGSVLTGSSETDWRTGLDESLRTDPSLADIKDISGLAKSYIHAQKMIGRDKLPSHKMAPRKTRGIVFTID